MTDREKAIEAGKKTSQRNRDRLGPSQKHQHSMAFNDGFKAGADWQVAQSGWIPIAEILEEWKDGRVLIMHGEDPNTGPYDYFCMFRSDKNGFWQTNGRTAGEAFLTHAMLPPSPPKETK